MTGIFPNGGVQASAATNTLPDGIVDLAAGCTPLWHSTSRCEPRFDPAAANAMMSEFLNLIACFDREYDCKRLDNLCLLFCDLFSNLFSKATVFQQGPLTTPLIPNGSDNEVGGIYSDATQFNGGIDATVLTNGRIRIDEDGIYRVTTRARIAIAIDPGPSPLPREVVVELIMFDQNGTARFAKRVHQALVTNSNATLDIDFTQPFLSFQSGGLPNNIVNVVLRVTPTPLATVMTAQLINIQNFIEKIAIKDFNCAP